MTLVVAFAPTTLTQSTFIPSQPNLKISFYTQRRNYSQHKNIPSYLSAPLVIKCSSSPHKLVRDPRLDKHVVKQNKIRFVQKLKTLLLSKPKHFMPIRILYKCRPYLSLPKKRSIVKMIRRYPTIFEFFTIPTPNTPFHASGPLTQFCVRLTPAATALAKRESDIKKSMAIALASKLQKFLMLASPYHRLLLSKLAHLGPDLGLPINFRSRLCNDHPDKFKVVDTSYGRALELVSWDSKLADILPFHDDVKSRGLIVDRPLKFKHLTLRKGLNLKRHHHNYLLQFKEMPDVCPYKTDLRDLVKESMEAEKRACASVREILAMTVEKRTLVDHLTHFRKELGLPNKLRGMLVRHPEMFYVSLKGQRDSVFLVESYSDKGSLLVKDEILVIKNEIMKLVNEGKRMRREWRKEYAIGDAYSCDSQILVSEVSNESFDDLEDGLDDLFLIDDSSSEDDECEELVGWEKDEFWIAEKTHALEDDNQSGFECW